MHWLELLSADQLRDLLEKEPVFAVFKHSTRCPTSSLAKSKVEREWNHNFPVYYLDVLRYRDVSSLLESLSGVRHESPQLIVFRDGRPVYHASHNFIFVREIELASI
jgi:bacillithiol system protein YtxJ